MAAAQPPPPPPPPSAPPCAPAVRAAAMRALQRVLDDDAMQGELRAGGWLLGVLQVCIADAQSSDMLGAAAGLLRRTVQAQV